MIQANCISLDALVDKDRELTWSVAFLAFFGFFCLGKLFLECDMAYTQAIHLSLEEVYIAVNNYGNLTTLWVYSKCDQFSRRANVYLRWTDNELCHVAVILS